MQRLYCSLAGLNRDEPESLIDQTPKLYDYDDVQTWLPKVMNRLVHAEHSNVLLSDLIHHLQGSISFRQFGNSQLRNMAIFTGRFFGRHELANDEHIALLDFFVNLFDSRIPAELGEVFGQSLSSLEHVVLWCLQRTQTDTMDDRIAITTFIAYYSLFGTAEADLVRSHSKDAINLFVQVFEEELDSKVDLRIRLNWLLAFYNIYTSHLSGSPTAKIASKVFDRDANMALVVRICADTIATGKGGLHATKVASLLLGQVVKFKPKKSLLQQAIKASFLMMRQDNPESERVQTVLQMMITMAQVDELKGSIVAMVESDEERHNQNLLLLNLKKNPLRHGALSETAAALLHTLELELNVDVWVDEQFNEVYDTLNGDKTPRNISYVYSKLSALAKLLNSSIKPSNTSTQLSKPRTNIKAGPIRIAKILCGSDQTHVPEGRETLRCMSEHCHFVFGTIHAWLGPSVVECEFHADIFYQRFLVQTLASLLESNNNNYRHLAMEIIRGDESCQINLKNVANFFNQQPPVSQASNALTDVTNKRTRVAIQDEPISGKRRRVTTGGTAFMDITTQRALALIQPVEEELEMARQLYENEKRRYCSLADKCQILEAALAVKSANHHLSHSLITSLDNKNARLGKDLEMEKRLKAEVEGEHEDLKSVLKGAMKYIQK